MANFTTTDDLRILALQNAGECTDGTSDFDTFAVENLDYMHKVIVAGGNEFDIELGEPWIWARKSTPDIVNLVPAYEDGDVALTKGSTAGTFSVAPAVGLGSFAGRFLKVESRPEIFRIASHTAGDTSITLDAEYTDDTTTGSNFQAMELDYDLPSSNLVRLIEPARMYKDKLHGDDHDGQIPGIDPKRFENDFPLKHIMRGTPSRFTKINEVDGQYTVRFNMFVDTETRVEFEVIPIPTTLTSSPDTTPLVPLQYRRVLAYAATYFIMVDKSDSRADRYFRHTQAMLQAMVQANRRELEQVGKNFGRLIPRLDRGGLDIRRVRTASHRRHCRSAGKARQSRTRRHLPSAPWPPRPRAPSSRSFGSSCRARSNRRRGPRAALRGCCAPGST